MKSINPTIVKFYIVVALICYPGLSYLYKNSAFYNAAENVGAPSVVKAAENNDNNSDDQSEIAVTPFMTQVDPEYPELSDENKEVKPLFFQTAAGEYKDNPVMLLILKINLVAPIVVSEKNSDGNMYVPPDSETVGWWKYGTKPGQFGSAVIAGHYKIASGAPGVFYNIDKLSVGDEIEVIKDSGVRLYFEVIGKEVYSVDNFPLNEFFNAFDGRRLNLITCSGTYLKNKRDYSHRLAVYAILKE